MQITAIGPLTISATTGIEVTAVSQDHQGIGYDVWPIWRPRQLDITLRITRPTRTDVLQVIDLLATDVYYNETLREEYGNVRRGVMVTCASRLGNVYTWLGQTEMRLLSIEQAPTGIIARVQVRGMVLHPPLIGGAQAITTTLTGMHSFALTPVTLSGGDDAALYAHNLTIITPNTTAIRDSIVVIESRGSASAVAQTRYISPTAASSNCVAETLPAGGTRYRVQSGTSATITYSIAPHALQRVPYLMYACVHVPSASPTPTMSVSWPGQSAIMHTISDTRTWYPIAVHDIGHRAHVITVSLFNISANTYIFPLLFVPMDGAHVWYVSGASQYNTLVLLLPERSPIGSLRVINQLDAMIYGPLRCITQQWLTITHGIAIVNMSTATSDITILSRATVPSAWL